MDELDVAILNAWHRLKHVVRTDPAERARRGARRASSELSRTLRPWSLCLRASDTRLDSIRILHDPEDAPPARSALLPRRLAPPPRPNPRPPHLPPPPPPTLHPRLPRPSRPPRPLPRLAVHLPRPARSTPLRPRRLLHPPPPPRPRPPHPPRRARPARRVPSPTRGPLRPGLPPLPPHPLPLHPRPHRLELLRHAPLPRPPRRPRRRAPRVGPQSLPAPIRPAPRRDLAFKLILDPALTFSDIAQRLSISLATVCDYANTLYRRRAVHSRRALLAAEGLPPPRLPLSPRQSQVLALLTRGHSTAQIAARLHLHHLTVRFALLDRIARKLGFGPRHARRKFLASLVSPQPAPATGPRM